MKELRQKVKQLHTNNLAHQEIADYLQISLKTVERMIYSQVGRPAIEEWKIQEIKKLVSNGARPTDISKQLKVCVPTIYKYAPKHRKTYVLIDPTGAKHHINNLLVFCDDKQLDYRCTRRVISGEVKHHKGWTTTHE